MISELGFELGLADVDHRIIDHPGLSTPAFVFFENRLLRNCDNLRHIADEIDARVLYSLKALSLPDILRAMTKILDGFSASSLYEARLAREIGGKTTSLHLTTPGIRESDVSALARLCDFVSLNSLSQLERFGHDISPHAQIGLRVNPGMSFAADPRYDPCAPQSRLGVLIDQIRRAAEHGNPSFSLVEGLHIHNNCESDDFNELYASARRLIPLFEIFGEGLKWVNLGGGYLFPDQGMPDALRDAIGELRASHSHLDIYLEPGTAIVQDAGILVTTVLDIIEPNTIPIAVLDTTVNHIPEVFEYQYQPDLYQQNDDGHFTFRLAGCTCLAGDVFGDYRFHQELKVGDRLCFIDVGSYSLVKANAFNGVPLPTTWLACKDGDIVLLCQQPYDVWRKNLTSS